MIRRRAEKGHVDELLGALDTLSTELDRPGLAVRIHVWTHRLSLDRELARGDSALGSVALALRARQLVSPRTRERLAAALERLVERAKRRPAPSEVVWVPHREILETRSELLGLASRLRDARPVYYRGVAMISRLMLRSCNYGLLATQKVVGSSPISRFVEAPAVSSASGRLTSRRGRSVLITWIVRPRPTSRLRSRPRRPARGTARAARR